MAWSKLRMMSSRSPKSMMLRSSQSLHIVAISGSLRNASCNHGLLRAAKKILLELHPNSQHTIDIVVPDLPLFNEDIEKPPHLKQEVIEFRKRLESADCFLFSTPEYNYSISSPLKNAIDWASRGPKGNVFDDKPAAMVGAGGGSGSVRSQLHLREIGKGLNLHFINNPEVLINLYVQPSPFDFKTGDLVNESEKKKVEAVVLALIQWAERCKPKK